MFVTVTQWVIDCTTEKDGRTACPARILWIIGTLVYFGLSVHNVWFNKAPFDMQAFAIGFGAMQAAGAAAVKIKETTEQKVE